MTRLLHEKSPVTSLCIYKDVSGIIQYCNHNQSNDDEIVVDGVSKFKPFANNEVSILKKEECMMDVDGEPLFDHDEVEEYLYYEEDQQGFLYFFFKFSEYEYFFLEIKVDNEKKKVFDKKVFETELVTDVQDPNNIDVSNFLCLTRETGNFYMYSLPNMQLVYLVKKFNQSPEVLYDDISSVIEDDQSQQQHNISLSHHTTVISQSTDNVGNSVSVLVKPEEVVF